MKRTIEFGHNTDELDAERDAVEAHIISEWGSVLDDCWGDVVAPPDGASIEVLEPMEDGKHEAVAPGQYTLRKDPRYFRDVKSHHVMLKEQNGSGEFLICIGYAVGNCMDWRAARNSDKKSAAS